MQSKTGFIGRLLRSAFQDVLSSLTDSIKPLGESIGSVVSSSVEKTVESAISTGIERLKQTDIPNGVMHKFRYTREEIYRVTALLNKETGEMLQKLSAALGIPEDETLGRLLVIGKFIIEKGLYGDPSASGMYLCIVNPATGEVIRIMLPSGSKQEGLPDSHVRLVN